MTEYNRQRAEELLAIVSMAPNPKVPWFAVHCKSVHHNASVAYAKRRGTEFLMVMNGEPLDGVAGMDRRDEYADAIAALPDLANQLRAAIAQIEHQRTELEIIARVAAAARTPTTRTSWIAQRARDAQDGSE